MEYLDLQIGKQDIKCTTPHFYLQPLNHWCLVVQPKLFADTLDTSEEITAPFQLELSYLGNLKSLFFF